MSIRLSRAEVGGLAPGRAAGLAAISTLASFAFAN